MQQKFFTNCPRYGEIVKYILTLKIDHQLANYKSSGFFKTKQNLSFRTDCVGSICSVLRKKYQKSPCIFNIHVKNLEFRILLDGGKIVFFSIQILFRNCVFSWRLIPATMMTLLPRYIYYSKPTFHFYE